MEKPGRNDPCYCGSGKKYKQCHLREDQQKEREVRQWVQAAQYLRRDLPRFARDERFAADFANALPIYWNNLYDISNADEMSEFEALRFFDWFVFDYELAEGGRVLDIYHAEERDELSSIQQKVLDAWLDAPAAGGYELTGYEGQILHLRDYLTGEEVDAFEASGRGNVEVGEVILVRLVPVHDTFEFSTVAGYLPADEITDVKEKMEAAKAADLAEHPGATHAEFMRRHGHLLVHHAFAEAKRVGRPPVARLDPQREEPPMPLEDHHTHDKQRVHRQRQYGRTEAHGTTPRRKAV